MVLREGVRDDSQHDMIWCHGHIVRRMVQHGKATRRSSFWMYPAASFAWRSRCDSLSTRCCSCFVTKLRLVFVSFRDLGKMKLTDSRRLQ